MKFIAGVLSVVTGLAFGAYFGLWWAFIGGIVDVVREVRAEDLDATLLAVGVAKVFFSGAIGWLSAAIWIVPGYFMIESSHDDA